MNKAVVIGQSHTACISAAVSANAGWDYVSVYRLRSGDMQNDPDALSGTGAVDLVQSLGDGVSLFLSGPGSYHNIMGLVRPPIEFDFLLQPGDTLVETAYGIPHRVVAEAFDQHLQTETLVPKMKAAAKGQVYLLACPPPKQDNAFMMDRLLAKWNKPYRGQDIAASGLNRPDLRRKLWVLECERLEAWAKRLDIRFVAAPAASFNEDGFLSERFYAMDATHANADYGLLMLELVASIANRPQGSA